MGTVESRLRARCVQAGLGSWSCSGLPAIRLITRLHTLVETPQSSRRPTVNIASMPGVGCGQRKPVLVPAALYGHQELKQRGQWPNASMGAFTCWCSKNPSPRVKAPEHLSARDSMPELHSKVGVSPQAHIGS